MPAKSQSQRGLVFGKRNRYGSKAKTPDKWKWIWDEDWENKGKLPKKKNKNETVQNVIMEKYRAKTVNEMFEEDVYGDPYVSDTTSPKKANSGRWAFNPGDVVKFSLKGSPEEYSSFEWPDNMDAQKAAKFYDGQVAKINYPEEKGSKVGNKDNEYYEIRFKDGETLEGVPGYYLEPHDIFSEPKPKGSRMKDPTQVEEGDKSIDYNGERGTVIDIFMKDNDPDLFDEIVSDWFRDPDNYEDDTYLINVKGPEYDYQWFVYGRGGAYVPE